MTYLNFKTFATLAVIGGSGFGAYTIYDRIPEVDPIPTNGPIAKLEMKDGSSTQFAANVRNPAGITWMADSNTYLVSTDNRVVAEVSKDFTTVLSQITLPSNPIGTGDTEGVAYLGNGRAAVVGERGVVVLIQRSEAGWEEVERFAIDKMTAGTQLGSAAFDASTNTLFTAQKTGAKRMYKINLVTRTVDAVEMTLSPNLTVKDGRDWSEFTIAGLGFDGGELLANSEAFSSVLTIQTTGVVTRVHGINNINEAAGLTVRGEQVVLVGDAESYLPKPPIYQFPRHDQVSQLVQGEDK
jgi:uncharacterized protein YjiK